MTTDPPERPYVLGHSPRELDRLDLQGEFYRDITERTLIQAGLRPGMHVLDMGCGTGDVSILCAEMIGPTGVVVGVDREEAAVLSGRARALERRAHNVTLEVGEVGPEFAEASFDALVGRFVLMHQPDPAATLSEAARCVRPGGLVIFMESHMAGLLSGHSTPLSPFYDRIIRWKCDVVQAAGADLEAGLRLRRTFLDAGLPEPTVRFEARIDGGTDSPAYEYMEESVRSMAPMAERYGVTGLDAQEIGTLADRLRAEAIETGGALVSWPLVSAWCRVP
jgi:ubiquinone/menaquinone biosynthesis C-methylase UbiE